MRRDACRFLYVGRLDPEKGLDVLLEAFREVPGELVLVGSGSAEADPSCTAPTLRPAPAPAAGSVGVDVHSVVTAGIKARRQGHAQVRVLCVVGLLL